MNVGKVEYAPDYKHKDDPESFWDRMSYLHGEDGARRLRIGYGACWWEDEEGKHCRKPKGHEGDHACH